MRSKFNLTINNNNLATQVSEIINSGNQRYYPLTPGSIISSPINFIIELDMEKVIGVIGLHKKSCNVTELKYLCVHEDYRNRGIGEKLLRLGIISSSTILVYGMVRSTNYVNIKNNFKVGMIPIAKYRSRSCDIIIFARRRNNVSRRTTNY